MDGMKKLPSKKPAPKKSPPKRKEYCGSIFSWPPGPLPQEFVGVIQELKKELKRDIWLLVQGDGSGGPYSELDDQVVQKFVLSKSDFPATPPAIVLDSPGGLASEAYRLAMLFRRVSKGYAVIIPRYAKSAATLLTLGADEIYLGDDAELGPLDTQVYDSDEEERWISALDEVSAIETLQQSAFSMAVAGLFAAQGSTRKRLNTLMPHVFKFVAELNAPLFQKVDAVRFTRMSRILDVAQQYAVRLLEKKYGKESATSIAHDLVANYPTHGLIINREETRKIGTRGAHRPPVGLRVERNTANMNRILDELYGLVPQITAIGRLTEKK